MGGAGDLDLVAVKPEVLALRVIPEVAEGLVGRLGLELPPGSRSLGLLTCTSDDALYVALDEGTKAAPVEVVYAKSFYAGAGHPSGPLSGEVIGIYAGQDPAQVAAALRAAQVCLQEEAWASHMQPHCPHSSRRRRLCSYSAPGLCRRRCRRQHRQRRLAKRQSPTSAPWADIA